jgi:hypothetical protein
MIRTCNTHGKDEKCMYDFGPKPHTQRDHLGDLSVDGRLLNATFKKMCEGIDSIHVTQGRDQWPLSTLNECTRGLISLWLCKENNKLRD